MSFRPCCWKSAARWEGPRTRTMTVGERIRPHPGPLLQERGSKPCRGLQNLAGEHQRSARSWRLFVWGERVLGRVLCLRIECAFAVGFFGKRLGLGFGTLVRWSMEFLASELVIQLELAR